MLNNDVGIESMVYDLSWPEHSTPSGTQVHCNNIVGNEDYGVQSVVYWHDTDTVLAEEVDATNNWWDDASGPSHSPGSGDKVSDNVTYDPWLPMEYQYCEECGGTPPKPSPPTVPTIDHWGILAMIALFAGLLVWTVRRRGLAS